MNSRYIMKTHILCTYNWIEYLTIPKGGCANVSYEIDGTNNNKKIDLNSYLLVSFWFCNVCLYILSMNVLKVNKIYEQIAWHPFKENVSFFFCKKCNLWWFTGNVLLWNGNIKWFAVLSNRSVKIHRKGEYFKFKWIS